MVFLSPILATPKSGQIIWRGAALKKIRILEMTSMPELCKGSFTIPSEPNIFFFPFQSTAIASLVPEFSYRGSFERKIKKCYTESFNRMLVVLNQIMQGMLSQFAFQLSGVLPIRANGWIGRKKA